MLLREARERNQGMGMTGARRDAFLNDRARATLSANCNFNLRPLRRPQSGLGLLSPLGERDMSHDRERAWESAVRPQAKTLFHTARPSAQALGRYSAA